MNKFYNIRRFFYIIYFWYLLVLHLEPKTTYAATTTCYDWESTGTIGSTLVCMASNLFNVASILLTAIVVILTIWLIYKTVTTIGSANSQKLQTLPMQWIYLVILIFVLAGLGTALLNFFFNIFGISDTNTWLDILKQALIDLGD